MDGVQAPGRILAERLHREGLLDHLDRCGRSSLLIIVACLQQRLDYRVLTIDGIVDLAATGEAAPDGSCM